MLFVLRTSKWDTPDIVGIANDEREAVELMKKDISKLAQASGRIFLECLKSGELVMDESAARLVDGVRDGEIHWNIINKPLPRGARIEVECPKGIISAYTTQEGDYPGICVMLKRTGQPCVLDLADVIYDGNADEEGKDLRSLLWTDAMSEEYTRANTFENVDKFFESLAKEEEE